MDLLLKNAQVYRDHHFAPADLLIRDGRIEAVGPGLTAEAPVLDAGGRRCVPGFLDVHTHGADHVDANAATPEDVRRWAAFNARHGTTGFLTSILTDTEEQTARAIGNITRAMDEGPTGGAAVLGIHLEGPFLSPQYKGAMPESLLRKGDAGWVRRCQQQAGGRIRYITVAPEVEGVPELIRALHDEIPIAIGHSGADYATARQAIADGARACTHTFNGMRLFHQHEPAIMGAVLASPDVYCEAICDGRHLHPGTVEMLLRCKGLDRVVAITDSIQAAGLPDGNYKLGVNDVVVKDGDAQLANGGGRAGSTLTMDCALRNLTKFTSFTLEQLIPLLTENPAALLGLPAKGRLEPGCDGDFVLLDGELNVAATVVGGSVVYQA
ncbi:MAG TPA: N-acetylglucosamine-6-phosphate deacetylase [Candidatus Gemmiger avistercoris]|uniref:N-acetylglucosamine-6-phosphate deacetylase n=1 Tax=Candidatus Gemmiger avistercoris TaxID=2838606 RepID=A0A9D2FIR2_9FIRM|nr:N-acetylglucosamine-6-phosphate deacetylase [uncultured Subdoligranulum sp.]HIZ61302.1 N-acetylglucosamine-6-phosphate deacetylase [Candidatus Gemmiger avistercoris]